MPQMSPMSWFYLFIYFISIYYMIMVMIYNLKIFDSNLLNNKNSLINLLFNKNLFKLKW